MLALDRLSLKAQILVSYSAMAAVVCAISIALSLIMLDSLSSNVNQDSMRIILSQTDVGLTQLATQLADTAAQEFRIIGNSMNKVSARYSKILLTSTDPTQSTSTPPFNRLASFPAYAEFNFVPGCVSWGGCPADFGPLSTRSRFPLIPGLENGSLAHSSAYIYSSARGSAIKDTVARQAVFDASPTLSDVRLALSVLDEDQRAMYLSGPSSTLMLVFSVKVTNATGQYNALYRTFPGMRRDQNKYDPTTRPWFTGARSDEIQFFGPYIETFTRQRIVTLSFKETFPYRDDTVEVVSAASVLVDNFRDIATSIAYPNGGFAVIFNKQTRQVLVWGNRTDLVDPSTSAFRTVHDLDPLLPADVCSEPTFEYTDASGVAWRAACASSFSASVSSLSGDAVTGEALAVMVFAQAALSEEPVGWLSDNVDNTSTKVRNAVLILVFGLSVVVMALALGVVLNITVPLDAMRRVALRVIDVMSEDEEARDFTPVLNKARFDVRRTDEVGVLACDFYQVMCLMHNKVVAKRAAPRYPANPWELECDERDVDRRQTLTWQDLRSVDGVNAAKAQAAQQTAAAAKATDASAPSTVAASQRTSGVLPSQKASSRRLSTKSSGRFGGRASNMLASLASNLFGVSGRVVPLTSDELVTISESRPVGRLTCLKTQLSVLAGMLVLGAVGAMLVTVLTVDSEGSSWNKDAVREVTAKQVANLNSIVTLKALFVETVFQQMSLDIATSTAFFASLMAGNLTRPTWEADGDYLRSHSLDPANPYSTRPDGNAYSFSGYFRPADAKCTNTSSPTCAASHNDSETRLTSLLDMKMQSLFYPGTYLSFLLAGTEATGLARFWPYRYDSTYADPTSCWVTSTETPQCAATYAQSKCGNRSLPSYPPYDVRCRQWYGQARHSSATVPAFQHPRDVFGAYVITALLPIFNPATGELLGGMSQNFLVDRLQSSINSLPIMTSGYSFIVDRTDIDAVVLHPRQTATCGTVQCVERFTAEEYAAFKSDVLLGGKDTYVKGGATWRAETRQIRYGSVDYLLVGTVPDAEVVAFATKSQDTVDQSVHTMVVGFGVAIVVVVVCMAGLNALLVRTITKPLDDLRVVVKMALHKDFSKELPKKAGSSDMSALMSAVTQLLVALRLGSGGMDMARTRAAFVDSVSLFTATGNKKGLGASLSNLAALELAMGNSAAAKEHYERSVELAKEQVSLLEAAAARGGGDVEAPGEDLAEDVRRARRVLSDRQGSLALVLVEQREMGAAEALLERLLAEDKRQLHIRGCVAKQSALGQVYLRQQRLADAERVFTASLALVHELQESAAVRGAAMSEADACEMLALCDLAALEEARTWRTTADGLRVVEHKYLQALMTPAHMELSTARRVLRSLSALYGRHAQLAEARRLVQGLADAYKLSLSPDATEGLYVARRVVLVVDYSSSMAGSRIRSLKDGLHAFMKERLCARDSVGILSFNNSVQEVLPLAAVGGNVMNMAKRVEALVAPVGKTAMYDGVMRALKVLQESASPGDWVVVVSDGADDKSKAQLNDVLLELASTSAAVVALGVGPDAPEDELQRLAKASRCGHCFCAAATKQDIADLFDQVSRVSQATHVALEEF